MPGRSPPFLADARHLQIASLATLLAIDFLYIDFGAKPLPSALAIAASLATQAACAWWFGLQHLDLRSPLITGVIPVPTFIERKQTGVVDMPTIDHLDAFTAPRLVEYHDEDPCAPRPAPVAMAAPGGRGVLYAATDASARYKGVTVEATYDVGEYDVSILSAKESDGLVNWLTDNGYRIPAGAENVLGSYIKQVLRRQSESRPHEPHRRRLSAAAAGALRDR